MQFCTFTIHSRLFGVSVRDVKEIHPVGEITPVSHASETVKGLVNIRGQTHLVIDLRLLLGYPPVESDDKNEIILFKPHIGESFGVLVDKIGDVVETDEQSIEKPGDPEHKIIVKHAGIMTDLILGICKLEQELMLILDSRAIFMKIIQIHLDIKA